jgi:endothelin-converting enzyme/putative endopeptidase
MHALLLLAALAAGPERPLAALPYTPGLDVAAMDRAADPCVDFYQFTCGGWLKANPVPSDQSRWSVYSKLSDENREFLWGLLEQAAARPAAQRSPVEARIGDYFAACMDEGAVEKAGAAPLKADLDAIARLRNKAEIAPLLGRLHPSFEEPGMLFGLSSEQDAKDATQVIGVVAPGGLGLPDRDYYVKDDARSDEIRERYEAHVARMLGLLGDPPPRAAAGARNVMRMETALARASLTQVDKRDPYKVYHRMTQAQLQALTPSFAWDRYLAATGAPRLGRLDVSEPAFMLDVEARLEEEPLDAWKDYLRWHLVDARAPYLSRAFQRPHFEFHAAYLNGVKEERARWKKCVGWVDRDLGFDLGQVFVAKAFPPPVKGQIDDVAERVSRAMAARIRELPWMTDATKKAALEKLALVRNKVAYPARWRDYGKLRVARGDFAGNVARSLRFETARQLAKVGRPVDREEWSMTPPTVNAYYDPQKNDMNFPAAVLLPPLWDPKMDLAPGYGNTGGTIGHELTHGFDDEGRQFDGKGNLRDWWTPEDGKAFARQASCVVEQYGAYPIVDDVKINSRLTQGEDVADLGGTVIAWLAWKDATRGQELPSRDGLTPAQRFFVGYAQWACENETDEAKRASAVTNPHSPARWRVNGVVANMPEFREAFACKPGQPMAREGACRVW